MVLNAGVRTLANRTVKVSVQAAPAKAAKSSSTREAEKDKENAAPGGTTLVQPEDEAHRSPSKPLVRGIKGLTFRKRRTMLRDELKVDTTPLLPPTPPVVIELTPAEEKTEEPPLDAGRTTKKRKVQPRIVKRSKAVSKNLIESEDEDVPQNSVTNGEIPAKRLAAEDVLDEAIARANKKIKTDKDVDDEETLVEAVEVEVVVVEGKGKKKGAAAKKAKEKAAKKAPAKKKGVVPTMEPVDDVIVPVLEDDIPRIATLELTPATLEVPLSATVSPTPTPEPPAFLGPPPDPFDKGLCEDDEDLYFARLVLAAGRAQIPTVPDATSSDDTNPDAPPPFRIHTTGSARTEGYYKIEHAEKAAYVAQYAARVPAAEKKAVEEPAPPAAVTSSSRSNRANARRRAQGLEEINQVQRAMALSKGEVGTGEQSVKYNQLQTRKKHLRFARSPIHDWGLYAMERIAKGEMVIEYVGEVIRGAVAERREKTYERQGIGSSYLFRIDEELVVDATKKGNLGFVVLFLQL
jgi:hypothetical protein